MIARILSLVTRRHSDLDLCVAPQLLTLHALTLGDCDLLQFRCPPFTEHSWDGSQRSAALCFQMAEDGQFSIRDTGSVKTGFPS